MIEKKNALKNQILLFLSSSHSRKKNHGIKGMGLKPAHVF